MEGVLHFGGDAFFKVLNDIMVIHSYKVETTLATGSRVASIDLLRGLVMIIMALDHVRVYMNFDSLVFSPTDLARTTPGLFFMRIVTHLCAPAFIFLAGTSIYFVLQRKSLKDTSIFLLTRGAWLILLQFTLIRFAWNFDPGFHYNSSNVISTIGFCMIAMAGLIHLRFSVVLVIGLVMVAGHNLFDGVRFEDRSAADVLWSFLHVRKLYLLGNDYSLLFLYPIVPWVGVMALGYCLGRLYGHGFDVVRRKRIILRVGLFALVVFFVLRGLNVYGDPMPWLSFDEFGTTVMSFFNVEKYPPSLLYLCLMLGISITVLGLLEGKSLKYGRPVVVFGNVAMFYYVLHIFAIHLVAMGAVVLAGYPWQTMVFTGANGLAAPMLQGRFGFSLAGTYLIWICVVLALYPLCDVWSKFKIKHKNKWWVSYV
jgi:uncharacterized membrane protein